MIHEALGRLDDLPVARALQRRFGIALAAVVWVVLAAAGYPDAPESGAAILGLDEAEAAGGLVFHAGTAERSGELVATGGRVLAVTALGESIAEAREQAYRAVEQIELPGVQYRQDIALAAIHAHA